MRSRGASARDSMLPPEEELPSDQDLRAASMEQFVNLRDRVNLALQMRAGKVHR
jgi:hypothetical protein